MTALSPETRRLLQLSRRGDDPAPARERAVRNRLVARLGVTALAGAASAAVLSGGAPVGAAIGSAAAKAASTGAMTATLAKTMAGLVLAAGLGAGVWTNDGVRAHAVEWSGAAQMQAEQLVQRAWQLVTGGAEDVATASGSAALPSLGPSISSEASRHELLIAIARRPNHPVAKEAELVLILGAEQALAAGDGERAARFLDQHQATFAEGELRDRREELRRLVDRASGKTNF